MTALPFFMLMEGQPSFMQDLHPLHFSSSTFNAGLAFTYFNSIQGRRLMMTDGSFAASSSFNAVSQA